MIDNIRVPSFANQSLEYLGCDSPTSPGLLQQFNNDLTEYYDYPYYIDYKFNSRGFRDTEWPNTVENKIWCVGDSATLGMGIPEEFRYSSLLPNTINCSRILADNEWLHDNAINILQHASPRLVIMQWTYFHRNYMGPEKQKNPKGSYGELIWGRMVNFKNLFIDQDKYDADYLLHVIKKVEEFNKTSNVIHLLTPNFHDGFNFLSKVKDSVKHVIHIDWIDNSRDKYFHYGVQSHRLLSKKIVDLCNEKNINIW
jgi:hypothetical protein